MHKNPWSSAGFETQICCLIIAPAFMAAGVYLTLKHIVIELGADSSRLRPKYYTWIFIGCDILSLVLQGAGGGLAASSKHGSSAQATGTDLMITGIVWQVITLMGFGTLVLDYMVRTRGRLTTGGASLLSTPRFKLFIGSLFIAYITIFTRCVYRIAELGPGWRNKIMLNEKEFIVLDSVMVAIATVFLTIFHPGYVYVLLTPDKPSKDGNADFRTDSLKCRCTRTTYPQASAQSRSLPRLLILREAFLALKWASEKDISDPNLVKLALVASDRSVAQNDTVW